MPVSGLTQYSRPSNLPDLCIKSAPTQRQQTTSSYSKNSEKDDRMTADLLTLDDIAAMHHCSIRHARDVLARISGHRDISLLHRVYYRATADEIARGLR